MVIAIIAVILIARYYKRNIAPYNSGVFVVLTEYGRIPAAIFSYSTKYVFVAPFGNIHAIATVENGIVVPYRFREYDDNVIILSNTADATILEDGLPDKAHLILTRWHNGTFDPITPDSARIIAKTIRGVVYVEASSNIGNADVWSVNRTDLSFIDKMTSAPGRYQFIDAESYPKWLWEDEYIMSAIETEYFTAQLVNARFPTLKTPVLGVTVVPGGMISYLPDYGPIVITPMVSRSCFRVIGVGSSHINKATGKYHDARILTAVNGTEYTMNQMGRDDVIMSDIIADSNVSRWKLEPAEAT